MSDSEKSQKNGVPDLNRNLSRPPTPAPGDELTKTNDSVEVKTVHEMKRERHSSDENDVESGTTSQASLVSYHIKLGFYETIRRNCYLFPLAIAVWIPLICLTPYTAAVIQKQMNPFFPYVSDTGTLAPQAGIFSMMMDIGAALFIVSAYYRYRMIKYLITVPAREISPAPSARKLRWIHQQNFYALWLITLTSFGTVCVGNFRVSELTILHFTGAGLCFLPMWVYYALQTRIAWALSKYDLETPPITMTAFTIFSFCGLLGFAGFSLVSIYVAGLENVLDDEWRFYWNPEEKGYVWHVLGTVFEWLAINSVSPLSFCVYYRMKAYENELEKI